MSFLTIEKFSPQSKLRLIKRLILIIFLLVVPIVFFAAWVFFDLSQEFKLVNASQAAAGVNNQINYQGKIADSTGTALAGGAYNFLFTLLDADTGGNALWEEAWTATTTAGAVTIADGIFSVALGTTTSMAASIFANNNVFLQVKLDANGDGNFEETFLPRRRLTASPYSFNSDTVDGLSATSTAATANQLMALDSNKGFSLINGITTTDSIYAGGYVSSTGGLFTLGDLRAMGKATVTKSLWVGAADTPAYIDMNGGDLYVQDSLEVKTEINGGRVRATDDMGFISGAGTNLLYFPTAAVPYGHVFAYDYDTAAWKDLRLGNSSLDPSQMILKADKSIGISTSTPESILTVVGASWFAGNVNIASDIYGANQDGTLNLGRNNSAWESLIWDDSENYFSLSDNLNINGSATATGVLIVSHSVTSSQNLYSLGFVSSTSGLYTQGNSHIGAWLSVDHGVTSTQSIYSGGYVSSTSGLYTQGSARIGQWLSVDHGVTSTQSIYSGGYVSSTSGLYTQGNLWVGGTSTITTFKTPYKNTVTVAESGGDYKSIQDALNGTTDAASNKVYDILIYPGEYTENIDMRNGKGSYKNLIGMGNRGDVKIIGSAGTLLQAPTTTAASFKNLSFISSGAISVSIGVGASTTQKYYFDNCLFDTDVDSANATVVSILSGNFIFDNNYFDYKMTGDAGGADVIIGSMGVSKATVKNSRVYFWSEEVGDAGGSEYSTFVLEMSANANVYLENNIVEMRNKNSAFVGYMVFYLGLSGGTGYLRNNNISITNDHGSAAGNGLGILTYAGGSIIHSQNNKYKISGYALNLFSYIQAGDTVNSQFDDYSQTRGYSNAGTLNLIGTANAGNLVTTGYVGVGTTTPDVMLSVATTTATVGTEVMFKISTTSEAGPTGSAGIAFKVTAGGEVYADGSFTDTGADYAEYFYTRDTDLTPGETVCLDILRNNAVKRCQNSSDSNVMGVISTKPAFLGNANQKTINNSNYIKVAMLGQIPAKASNENGEIRPGDSLASASIPGYVMKANAGDSTVAVALEGLDSETGLIQVMISRRNKSLSVEEIEQKVSEHIAAMEIEDEVQLMVQKTIENYDLDSEVSAIVNPFLAMFGAKYDLSLENINSQLTTLGGDLLQSTLAIKDLQNQTDFVALASSTVSLQEKVAVLSTNVEKNASDIKALQAQVADLTNISSSTLALVNQLYGQKETADVSAAILNNPDLAVNNLAVKEAAEFSGSLTVLGEAFFNNHVYFDNDSAGVAVLPANATATEVLFNQPYQWSPVVVVTPQTDLTGRSYWIFATNKNGFHLAINPALDSSVKFNWQASAVKDFVEPGLEDKVGGCQDNNALNYNSLATFDDGSCQYPAAEIASAPTVEPLAEEQMETEEPVTEEQVEATEPEPVVIESVEPVVETAAESAPTEEIVVESATTEVTPAEGNNQ